jgi:hypothetical protein
MRPNNGAQQLPGSRAPVDPQHPENLEEPETTDRGRREHL